MDHIGNMIKKVTFVRHGESREQSGETNDGKNPALSSKGLMQATWLKEKFTDIQYDLILVSPLDRAYHTYRIAKPVARKVQFDSRLIEIDWISNWYEDMLGYAPDPAIGFRDQNSWLTPVSERSLHIMHDLLSMEYSDILLMAHQGVFRHLLGHWLDIPAENLIPNLFLDNISFTQLSVDEHGKRYVNYLNRL